jgi:hypothetical protein
MQINEVFKELVVAIIFKKVKKNFQQFQASQI